MAKYVFQARGADTARGVRFARTNGKIRRFFFFGNLRPCVVAIDACGSAHFPAYKIGERGHYLQLIQPADVKRQKNDAADAEAICQRAAWRPAMRFAPVKAEQN